MREGLGSNGGSLHFRILLHQHSNRSAGLRKQLSKMTPDVTYLYAVLRSEMVTYTALPV